MSPKLPRDISDHQLVKDLTKFGYSETRQKGSHIRLSKVDEKGEHHITIPDHNPLKLGTLNSILNDAATHLQVDKDEIIKNL